MQREAGPQTALVQIEKPIYGGAFLARVEGKATFVPLTLPGEQARVRIIEEKRSYAAAEPEEIVAPAAGARRTRAVLTSAFAGAAAISTRTTKPNLGSSSKSCAKRWNAAECSRRSGSRFLLADPWSYRNRIRLAFDAAGRVGYRGRRSHEIRSNWRMSHRSALCS